MFMSIHIYVLQCPSKIVPLLKAHFNPQTSLLNLLCCSNGVLYLSGLSSSASAITTCEYTYLAKSQSKWKYKSLESSHWPSLQPTLNQDDSVCLLILRSDLFSETINYCNRNVLIPGHCLYSSCCFRQLENLHRSASKSLHCCCFWGL